MRAPKPSWMMWSQLRLLTWKPGLKMQTLQKRSSAHGSASAALTLLKTSLSLWARTFLTPHVINMLTENSRAIGTDQAPPSMESLAKLLPIVSRRSLPLTPQPTDSGSLVVIRVNKLSVLPKTRTAIRLDTRPSANAETDTGTFWESPARSTAEKAWPEASTESLSKVGRTRCSCGPHKLATFADMFHVAGKGLGSSTFTTTVLLLWCQPKWARFVAKEHSQLLFASFLKHRAL